MCFFQFGELKNRASLVIGTVEINNKKGRAIQAMTWPSVKINKSKGNSKIYDLITHLFHLPFLTISPWRLIEHGTSKEFTIPQLLKKPLALQRYSMFLFRGNQCVPVASAWKSPLAGGEVEVPVWWQYKQNKRGSSSHKDLIIVQQYVNRPGLRGRWTAKLAKHGRILGREGREKSGKTV